MEGEESGQVLRGVYVLLVDDNAQHRSMVRDILRYCGAWVRDADGADEAQAVLRETTPTALVVVVRPPGDVAWRLVDGIRGMRPEHGGKLPVIGVGPLTLASTAREHGLDAYVAEPLDAFALCRAVAEMTQ
jgi:CheY-like chemotaxis protein